MPTAPPRWCPKCRAAHSGKCPEQRHSGGKTSDRGYGWDWQRFRKQVLRTSPLCVDCEAEGRVSVAEELHHVVKIKDAPHLRLDPDNVLPLCGRHHDERTAKGE